MKETRFAILLGSVWEMVRFLALLSAVLGLGLPALRGALLWLLLFGSGQLVLPAAFLFLSLDPPKYRSLRPFLILGKGIGIFCALLLALLEPLRGAAFSGQARFLFLPVPPLLLLWLVTLFDLALLGALLVDRAAARLEPPGGNRPLPGGPDPRDLPDFQETWVEDPPRGC